LELFIQKSTNSKRDICLNINYILKMKKYKHVHEAHFKIQLYNWRAARIKLRDRTTSNK
jgi:hypothetical protein